MRVLVATDQFPALSSAQAGAAIGTAWAELGAQVAVVPVGNAGEGFHQALADLLAGSGDVVSTDHGIASVVEADTRDGLVVAIRPETQAAMPAGIEDRASTGDLGALVRALVDAARTRGRVQRIILETPDLPSHDGGAGLLGALGARADRPLGQGVEALAGISCCDLAPAQHWLDGARLDLVVPVEETSKHLVGLKGITSVRGRAVALDPAVLLATDQALVDLASAVVGCADGAIDHSRTPGAGASGGLGFAVLALGGTITTGARCCAALAGVERTIAQADLVVTGGAHLDFGTMGGDVRTTITALGAEALRPVVVIAEQNFISARELRSIGVEAAYSVRPETGPRALGARPVDAEELLVAARRVATSWTW